MVSCLTVPSEHRSYIAITSFNEPTVQCIPVANGMPVLMVGFSIQNSKTAGSVWQRSAAAWLQPVGHRTVEDSVLLSALSANARAMLSPYFAGPAEAVFFAQSAIGNESLCRQEQILQPHR